MTQQPFQPGYPAQQYPPQQGYPAQAPYTPAAPGPVQQQYPPAPPAPQGYPAPAQPQQYAPAPQGYPAQGGYQQPPVPEAAPLLTGTLDEFYAQPSTGGGPSLSWVDALNQPKPIGTSYTGVVARDVHSGDVQQQTDFQTKAPLFYRDGRPKFSMKVPLQLPPSQEHPEGEAAWYVKGQGRDELTRAMAAAGITDGTPRAGDQITITLVNRKPMQRGMNPQNVVQVQYSRGGAAPAPVAQPAPVQQYAPQQPPAPQYAPPAPVQQYQAPAPVAQPPVQQYAPPAPAPVAQPAPVQQAAPPAPAGLTPEQQALLGQLTSQQQAG